MADLKNIEKILQQKLQRAVQKLPTVLVNEAVNWTKGNFDRQGFPGRSFQAWPKRNPGTKNDTGRKILVKTGRLKRSIRKISTGALSATFGTDVPYARAHNDGFTGTVNVRQHQRAKLGKVKMSTGKSGKPFKTVNRITGMGTVKAHQRRMKLPRRRFIGYSPVLQSILKRKAVIIIGRELKS